jgi:hypothetical protein
MRNTEHLTQMANDIGNFFRAQGSREDAIVGIANHLNSFWTRRMRETLLADTSATHTRDDRVGLDELPRAALYRLVSQPTQPNQPLGGDAG